MSRTFILASAAAALITLTGTSAQAGGIVERPLGVFAKEVAAKWWPAVKPAAKIGGHVVFGLAEHEMKQAYKDGVLFGSVDEKAEDLAQAPNGVISWKTLNGEQIRAAIAATALTAVEPQAPAFK